MRRVPRILLLAVLIGAMPLGASAAPTLRIISQGLFVAGTRVELTFEVLNARSSLRLATGPQGPFLSMRNGSRVNQYDVSMPLPSSRTPYDLSFYAIDSTGPSAPVSIAVSPPLAPRIAVPNGALIAGERSRFTVPARDIQKPTVFLDAVELTDVTSVEADALIISPLLTAVPSDCRATLRVVNVSKQYATVPVGVKWGAPVITGIKGNLVGGQLSSIAVEGERFAPGATAELQTPAGRRIAAATVSQEGQNRLSLTVQPPSAAGPYDATLRVDNPCNEIAARHPLRVNVPLDVQPAIASITHAPAVGGSPIVLTVEGNGLFPATQFFVAPAGRAFTEVKDRKFVSATTLTLTVPASVIDPMKGTTVTVKAVNPGDPSKTSHTKDVAIAPPRTDPPKEKPPGVRQ